MMLAEIRAAVCFAVLRCFAVSLITPATLFAIAFWSADERKTGPMRWRLLVAVTKAFTTTLTLGAASAEAAVNE